MKLKINHESPIPLHIQVEELLRDLIAHPEYKEGKLLPKEVELAKKLGISRNTVRQATNKLSNENLLVRKKGIGTRVATNNMTTQLSNWYSFSDEMQEHGITLINFEIKASWVEASEEVRQALELATSDSVLQLERLRGTEDGPTVFFVSYFHPRVGLTTDEDYTRHLYEIMEQDHSTVATVSKEEIKAMLADEFIAEKLQVRPGDPVLFRKRMVYDPGNRPIEYNLGYYQADKFSYAIEINRK